MKKIVSYLKLIRVDQWVKNVFILLPLFFSFRFTEIPLIIAAALATTGFCLIASCVYIINDWNDIEQDRLHPTKKNRPLASGVISKSEALVMLFILLAGGVCIYTFALQNINALILVVSYLILNILYSFKLKHIPILDICIVAIGFVIRVFIGGLVTGILVSNWLIIMTFLLSLFMVLGKRRDDVVIAEKTGNITRKNIKGYNLTFLNAAIMVSSAIILVSYIMYTISPDVVDHHGEYLYLTTLFVFMGLFRYMQIIFVEERSGSPTKVLIKDHFIHIIIVCWGISFVLIHYFLR
ncbi:decaprenyl-phosphate phosphoribosyltransferase [Dysgonomonas sp. 25]|uniref:decaprenyl-phosphate phosphoribosyltransferase n=1 Tax=Dysgonomonas sp. 25 TaxID=2302933 RepID=UPI0013D8D362|nr:decaprenyl-phosphate phosphoribosyltransferase [Dysgonomonas sp. 25]NDV68855.1 decaprenyl-phosphate phosphoribosyltransferase [Dysgonomonas sp. 25]